MNYLLIYYNFILIGILTILSFLQAQSPAHIVSAIIFFPLFAYFMELAMPKRAQSIAIVPPQTKQKITRRKKRASTTASDMNEEAQIIDGEIMKEGVDIDRRAFLKIIGMAGTGLLITSLFTKKTHAAFFGSVPGPGTISVKDSTGSVIDPAIKTPTDGYKISEIDDASSPAYYGFVEKDGAWFIIKEDSAGAYRYTKGNGSFSSSGWAHRNDDTLTYGYFDEIFS